MRFNRRRFTSLLFALVFSLCLTACGSSGGGKKDIIKVGTTDNLGTFLYGAQQPTCVAGTYLVYDSIFYTDPDKKEAYSLILDSWKYENDTTFVMKLKDGITFNNGDKMTGEDILFSLSNYAERRAMVAQLFMAFDFKNSYVKDDGLTVVLKTFKPYGPGLRAIDIPVFNKSWSKKVGWNSQDWLSNPVGSGPYKVVEYVTDSYARFVRRDDFWGNINDYPIKEFVLKYYAEDSTEFVDLQTGAIDLALGIAENDYSRAQKGIKNIAVKKIPAGDNLFFCMDIKNKFIKDFNVRKALVIGVDWKSLGNTGFGSLYQQPSSILASINPYYVKTGNYDFDKDAAKKLLKDAGYTDGQITFNFVCMMAEQQKIMAESLQFYLKELGINLNLRFFDFPTTIGKWLSEGGTDFGFQSTLTGAPSGEPYISLQHLMVGYGSFPYSTIDDDKFIKLAVQGLQNVDTKKRAEAYKELQKYAYDKLFLVPISENCDALAFNTDVIADVKFDHAKAANLREIKLKK